MRKAKRIVIILMAIMLAGLLAACDTVEMKKENIPEVTSAMNEVGEQVIDGVLSDFFNGSSSDIKFKMEYIAKNGGFYLYRCEVTDVLYIRFDTDGGLTVMVDPDTGLPLTYTRYLELGSKEETRE